MERASVNQVGGWTGGGEQGWRIDHDNDCAENGDGSGVRHGGVVVVLVVLEMARMMPRTIVVLMQNAFGPHL